MSDDLPHLTRRLSRGAVVTDDGVMEGYRRDRAATVPAGRPRAVIRPSTVAEVSKQLGPASLAVHQAIKTALDPSGILNPGRSF
jgi:FAD/FMN-containing dehydrogenase